MKASNTAATVFEDALVYLRSIQPNVYQQKILILFDVSIGQHTRHFIEFYQFLLQQVSEKSTSIDYVAIIKIGLKAIAPQIQIPAHFGVATSTTQNHTKVCAQ